MSSGAAASPVDAAYRDRTVLVLGGAGFIGGALARRLCRAGARVTVVDCFEEHGGAQPLHLADCGPGLELDRRDAAEALDGRDLDGVDFVFNCVGLTDHHLGCACPDLDYRLNCASVLPWLRRLAGSGAPCRLVSIGTRGQYGAGDGRFRESDPLRPLDVQAVHKTALEHYHFAFARGGRLRFAFVRMTNTYGPGQRMRGGGIGFMGELLRCLLEGRPLTVYGSLDRVKDLLYVDDAVEGLLRVAPLAGGPDPIYNLGGQPCRVGELVDLLARCDERLEVRLAPFPEQVRRLDAGDASLAVEKLARATGWAPRVPLERGLPATLDYYRRHRAVYWP